MKTALLILGALTLTACSTVNTGKNVLKTTGKVAVGTGKVIYKTGELTGKAVYKTGEATGKAVYKTGEVTGKAIYKTGEATGKTVYKVGGATGKAVVDMGKGSVAAIDRVTSKPLVQKVTLSPTPENVDRVGDKGSLGEAMLTPLSDINLRKQRIPEKLASLESAYEPLPVMNCDTLLSEIITYDDILGPDFDSERFESKKARSKRKRREIGLDVAEAGVGSFVPFRSILRAATGAKLHENNIRKAYRKGVARRGYLRGVYEAQSCSA